MKGTPMDPDPVSWAEVYRAERPGMVRLAYLLVGSQAVAEDLVQDSFVRVMARVAPSSAGAYLRRTVINACWSWHRRTWRETGPGPGNEPYAEPSGAADAAADTADLWDAVDRLRGRRRMVVVLRFYMDMSEQEVADALGCRVGTVKSATSRALEEIRRSWTR